MNPQDSASAYQSMLATLGPGTDETQRLAQQAYDTGNQAEFQRLMQKLPMMELKDGKVQRRPEHAFQNTLLGGLGLATAGLAAPALFAAPAAIGGGAAPSIGATAGGTGADLYAPPAALAGSGGAAAGGGASALSQALPYLKAGLAGASVIGGITHNASGSGLNQIPPELQQILNTQVQRMQSQQPLYDAITKMAMNRLPISAQATFPKVGG